MLVVVLTQAGILILLVQTEAQVQLELQAQAHPTDLQASAVLAAQQVQMVPLEAREIQRLVEHQEQSVLVQHQDNQDRQEQAVLQEQVSAVEHQEHREHQGRRAPRALRGRMGVS